MTIVTILNIPSIINILSILSILKTPKDSHNIQYLLSQQRLSLPTFNMNAPPPSYEACAETRTLKSIPTRLSRDQSENLSPPPYTPTANANANANANSTRTGTDTGYELRLFKRGEVGRDGKEAPSAIWCGRIHILNPEDPTSYMPESMCEKRLGVQPKDLESQELEFTISDSHGRPVRNGWFNKKLETPQLRATKDNWVKLGANMHLADEDFKAGA
ncbi:hypothetical protein NHQ30_010026 [Ciborinia camelliae]|nr:hypothetical protein NHQ30_010026 [Ciborinia camelliae]